LAAPHCGPVPQAAATRFVDTVAEQLRAVAKEAQDRVAASRPVGLSSLEELLNMTPTALGMPGDPAARMREGTATAAATERALRALDQLAAWADGLTYDADIRGSNARGDAGVGAAPASQSSTAAVRAPSTTANSGFNISNDATDAAAVTAASSALYRGMDGGLGGTGGLLGAELAPAVEELEEAVAETAAALRLARSRAREALSQVTEGLALNGWAVKSSVITCVG
jgi:hypothetical protein